MDEAQPPPGHVLLGKLGRSFGLEGALRVQPRDERALQALQALDEVFVEGLGPSRVEEVRPHGREWLLRLGRVQRVERARTLGNARVWGDPDRLDAQLGERLTQADPTGLPVLVDGAPWGEVLAREGGEALAWLRVRGPSGELLLPAWAPYVRTEADAIHVEDPPAGLLDDAS